MAVNGSFVPIASAEDRELAESYRDMLEKAGITATVKDSGQDISNCVIFVKNQDFDFAFCLIEERMNNLFSDISQICNEILRQVKRSELKKT